jgi:hypothetical protein
MDETNHLPRLYQELADWWPVLKIVIFRWDSHLIFTPIPSRVMVYLKMN